MIITLSIFGLTVIYFIIFGDIASSIVLENIANKNSIVCKRVFYVVAMGLIALPLILQKEIAHLKIVSYTLFAGIILFILIFIFQLIFEGTFENFDDSYE